MTHSWHVYRCGVLVFIAAAMALVGWLGHFLSVAGIGIGWLLVSPGFYKRPWRKRTALRVLIISAALGGIIGYMDAFAVVFKCATGLGSLLLAWIFLRTIIPPHTALITAIGEESRGPLGAHLRAYTGVLTWFWGLFLLLSAIVALVQLASHRVIPLLHWLPTWQLPIAIAVFVLEFYLRKLLFPAHNHPSFKEYLQIVAAAMAKIPLVR